MTNELLNTKETYITLQPFTTVEELNENTIKIRELYADQLTPSTKKVLDVLHRYSCKYPGLSYRSKAKIAIELGIDRKTVTRACQQLESLGIIEQYELKRHNGDRRRSSNAIVFVSLISANKEEVPAECPNKETLLNSNKPKQSFHDTFASQPSLFNRFKSLLSNSVGDATLASRLYGIYKAQSIKLMRFTEHAEQGELFEDLAFQALHITTQATKRKKIKSLTGYFDGVLRELIGKVLFDDAFKDYNVAPDLSLCTH